MTTKVAVRERWGGGGPHPLTGRGSVACRELAWSGEWGVMIMRLRGCHTVACVRITRSMECFIDLKCVETIITCQLALHPGRAGYGMMV